MITVEVTSTNYIVSATEISYDFTVSADDYLFTVTNITPNFTVTNITPTFNFTADGSGFEFANKFLGDWVSGDRYYRNDVVQYQYSTYICGVESDSYVESSTPPPNDTSSWILFIFNEWPRAYLTITNTLSVGSTATFNILNVGSNSSTGTFAINGLQYPQNKGTYGQVLYTNGTTDAAWVNLGELTFWELSEDLQTVGYNIVTGAATGDPNPQLTIGSGATQLGNNTSTFKSFIKFDAVDGATALGNIRVKGSTLFYNTVTMASSLTVNGANSVNGNLSVSGNASIGGTLNVTGASTLGRLTATATNVTTLTASDTLTANGVLNANAATNLKATTIVGALTQSGGAVNIAGGTRLTGKTTTTNILDVVAPANFYSDTYISHSANLVGYNFDTNTSTFINVNKGFRFPDGSTQDTGISAAMRVVAGTGISTSTNIDGATVVSLLTATTSTIGGIKVSNPFSVSNGFLGIEQTQGVIGAFPGQMGIIQIGRGLGYVRNGKEVDVVSASTSSIGGIMVGDFLTINTETYLLSVNTATLGPALNEFSYILPIASTSTLGGIKVGNGFEINSSTGVFSVSGATTSTLGGVVVGEYLTINTTTDVLSVNTATLGPVLAQSFSYTLNTATDTVLGGIKVGEYLSINSSTGVLSVNTATLAPALIDITLPIATDVHLGGVRIPAAGPITINTTTGDISVPFATKGVPVNVGTPGVVRVGANLVIDGNGVIDVLEAGATTLGVVKPGFGLTVAAGALSVNTATTTRPGIIQVGTTLSIDANAVLNVNSSNAYGNINLSEDMETNGYAIRYNATYPNSKLLLGTASVDLQANALNKLTLGSESATLQATTQSYVTVTATSVVITTPNTSTAQVLIQTPELVVGSDIYNSQIQASAYYDFSGTGAAFFPANVKFSDDTIQRTAWRGYDQGLI